LEVGRAFLLSGLGGKDKMHVPEAYVGSEERLEVRIREKETREMQNVLSRLSTVFSQGGLSTNWAMQPTQRTQCRTHFWLPTSTWINFKGQAQMSTWLTAIVTNCARMQLRRRPRQTHLSLDEQSQGEREYFLVRTIGGPWTKS